MKAEGIVESGDALDLGIGALSEAKIADFYDKMVAAGVIDAGLDIATTYTTEFVNAGLGMELKPAN